MTIVVMDIVMETHLTPTMCHMAPIIFFKIYIFGPIMWCYMVVKGDLNKDRQTRHLGCILVQMKGIKPFTSTFGVQSP